MCLICACIAVVHLHVSSIQVRYRGSWKASDGAQKLSEACQLVRCPEHSLSNKEDGGCVSRLSFSTALSFLQILLQAVPCISDLDNTTRHCRDYSCYCISFGTTSCFSPRCH